LRVVARYESLEDIRNLPVGNGLRLQDVADVYVEDRAEQAVYRVDSGPGIFLDIYKESTANTVDVARRIRETLETVFANDPRFEGMQAHIFFDQGEIIQESLGNLQQTALFGGVFAVLVLFFFLRRVGMTVLIALAIPVSVLMTVVVMYFTGRTLNVLTLTGLMLSVGMVVDNSIVVVESIQRRQQQGMDQWSAAYYGAADVALAILVATLTTVVVFVPMILMSGNETLSFYLGQIGLPVCVGLVSSLFVSLVFIPLAATFGLGSGGPARVRSVEWIERAYGRLLALVLRRRADAAILGTLVFASIAIPIKAVPSTDQADANINDFEISIDYPAAMTWDERVDHLMLAEAAIWDHRDDLYVVDLMTRMGGTWGSPRLRAFLVDPDEREPSREELIEAALEVLPEAPGVGY
ncbi:MAG: efflux RND transporter permease subunit, partial [Phycisphaerales bacterium]|nr:efflux RND transporter permease subunit [Phycisphaerales bacterium]